MSTEWSYSGLIFCGSFVLLYSLYTPELYATKPKISLFSKLQFDFRTGLSTNDSLFRVNNFIRKNMDDNLKVIGIFLVVHKAIDCVNYELLLRELTNSRIRRVVLHYNIFRYFLSDRT